MVPHRHQRNTTHRTPLLLPSLHSPLPPGDPSVKYGNPRSLPMVEIAKNVSLFCDLSALPPTARVYRGKVRTAAGGLQEILQRCLGVMLR